MTKHKIVLHKSHDHGDWFRLDVDGEPLYEGHEISTLEWLELLKDVFGCEVTTEGHTEEWWAAH